MKQQKRPSQHYIAAVTYLALVPLVYFIPDYVGLFFPGSKLLSVIVALGIIVPIITYVVIPLASRIYSRLT